MTPELRNPFSSARIVGKQVSNDDYRKQDVRRGALAFVMSRSDLCEFAHCPNRWVRGFKRKDSGATEFGTLMDGLLLDRGNFQKRFAIEPDVYPCEPTKKDPRTEKPWNNNATFCFDWAEAEEAAGRTVVSRKDYERGHEALAVLLDDPDIYQLIAQSEKQVHVVGQYHDRDTELTIPVQALVDIVPLVDHPDFGKCLMDFKTARSAEQRDWKVAVHEHDYDKQAALHLDLYTAATGEDRCDFRHIIQENVFPWQTGKRFMEANWLDDARLQIVGMLRLYCACLASNHWPGYERNPNKLNINGFEVCEQEAWMIGC